MNDTHADIDTGSDCSVYEQQWHPVGFSRAEDICLFGAATSAFLQSPHPHIPAPNGRLLIISSFCSSSFSYSVSARQGGAQGETLP